MKKLFVTSFSLLLTLLACTEPTQSCKICGHAPQQYVFVFYPDGSTQYKLTDTQGCVSVSNRGKFDCAQIQTGPVQ